MRFAVFTHLIVLLALAQSFQAHAKVRQPVQSPVSIPEEFLRIGEECGVPPAVLYSVALTETEIGIKGQKSSAWPYSINWMGKGYRFKDRQETFGFAQKLIKQGHTLFDIGIMQVNWRWHNERVNNLWDLTDTEINIRTACSILTEGYEAKKNWFWAAGYYHAPNNDINARKYVRKYRSKLNNVLRKNPEARKAMRKYSSKLNNNMAKKEPQNKTSVVKTKRE